MNPMATTQRTTISAKIAEVKNIAEFSGMTVSECCDAVANQMTDTEITKFAKETNSRMTIPAYVAATGFWQGKQLPAREQEEIRKMVIQTIAGYLFNQITTALYARGEDYDRADLV